MRFFALSGGTALVSVSGILPTKRSGIVAEPVLLPAFSNCSGVSISFGLSTVCAVSRDRYFVCEISFRKQNLHFFQIYRRIALPAKLPRTLDVALPLCNRYIFRVSGILPADHTRLGDRCFLFDRPCFLFHLPNITPISASLCTLSLSSTPPRNRRSCDRTHSPSG